MLRREENFSAAEYVFSVFWWADKSWQERMDELKVICLCIVSELSFALKRVYCRKREAY